MTTTLVCVLDGCGLNPNEQANAVALANTPNLDSLLKSSPHTTLITHGERVGLPAGQMGNSEVGHLNIGAGRVVEQSLLKIARAFKQDRLSSSSPWINFIAASQSSPTLHVAGLYSDGGVHSHSEHLHLLLPRLRKEYKGQIALHLFTDGRDTSETAFGSQLPELLKLIEEIPNCLIATISGRYFAMDRDNRWDRVSRAYDAMVLSKGSKVSDPISAIQASYEQGIKDEFVEPMIVNPIAIEPQDSVLCFNFRTDRMREIVSLICTETPINGVVRHKKIPAKEKVLCFTCYDAALALPVLFESDKIKNHLGEVVSNHGFTQLRVAETEKYPHVTYFLNGMEEAAFKGEERVLIPSPRDVKTYDLKPEMSANQITDEVLKAIESDKFRLIVVNFANCDMVGHSGNLSAAIKAVECVDFCVGRILESLKAHQGNAMFFADHGNAEQMINYEDGSPHTAHTTFPVPAILFGLPESYSLKDGGSLCDLAPTVLEIMGIEKPSEMTGTSLLQKSA